MKKEVLVYVAKHGASYRYRAGEWTSSQRLADRFRSAVDAWEAVLGAPYYPHPERWRVVRLVPRRGRRCRSVP